MLLFEQEKAPVLLYISVSVSELLKCLHCSQGWIKSSEGPGQNVL